ncbi:mitochondrial import inner membrane translocase subunit Tim29 [Sceloporus undulatus]|uniref:mitochondrial import inner membrane translocase subunit Tim29 n=1 Tax=Sceloporus undulatus TaxID=8520 RepID=UPI001C4DB153|nr:mitochondrial import inner membrane translocase subunit Tim29 [Sceloporus undulatus]
MAAPQSEEGKAGEKRSPWQRLRGGRLALWWSSLLQDYAEAFAEVVRGIRRRPGLAGLWAAVLSGAVGCSLRSPGEASFEAGLLEASGALLLLSPGTRSTTAKAHLRRLLELRDQGRLRFQSLLLLSVVYEAPFDAGADLYLARCPHLQPRWAELPRRLLDVGFWGQWWVLRARMKDADINEEEFSHLPERLRIVTFHHLHSEANEKLFEKKYKPVVLTEEQIQEAERESRGPRLS